MATTKKKTTTRKTAVKKPFTQIEREVEESFEEDPTVRAHAVAHSKEVVAAVSNITAEGAVEALSKASVGINKTLAELQSQILTKVDEYKQLDEAIAAKTEELQKLFDNETVLYETSALIAKHGATLDELARAEEAAKRVFNERELLRQQQWARDEQEYNYRTQQARRLNDDKFQQEDKQRLRAITERDEDFKKAWATRENELKAREEEFLNYKTQVENFPKKLEDEVNKAVSIATNSVKKDLSHTFALEKSELQTQIRLAQQRNAQDETVIKAQAAEIERLRSELSNAQNKIVDISKSGFDSVSGQVALKALQDVAANNGPSAKTKS